MEKNIKTERLDVKVELIKPLQLSQTWYTIEVNWWEKWKKFVNFDEEDNCIIENQPPGPIDNQVLLADDLFNINALERHDYEIVPETVWNKLLSNHGCKQNDTAPFQRKVIEQNKQLIVDTKLFKVIVSVYEETDNKSVKLFSSSSTLETLEKYIINEFNIPKGSDYFLLKVDDDDDSLSRLYSNSDPTVYSEISAMTLMDLNFNDTTAIKIDIKDSNGVYAHAKSNSFPSEFDIGGIKGGSSVAIPLRFHPISRPQDTEPFSKSSCSTDSSDMLAPSAHLLLKPQNKQKRGVCGLANLGNTCFMNSAIQCISNVPELTKYFLSKSLWQADLNKTNPLGMKGRIATAYAKLIEEIWNGNSTYVIPRDFKLEVAEFAPQFSGFSQHDSQELMMFLLDGLHEDLNRIINKPYIELTNCTNQPDKVLADTNWDYHLRRNSSVIVDNFHGQLKSKVVCPDCGYVSLTFDPFASLSLPVGQLSQNQTVKHFNFSMLVVPWDSNKALLNVTIDSRCFEDSKINVTNLKELLAKHIDPISPSQLRVVKLEKRLVKYVYSDDSDLTSVKSFLASDQLVAYELPPPIDDHFYIDMNFRKYDDTPLSIPLYLQLSRQLNWTNLLNALSTSIQRFSSLTIHTNHNDNVNNRATKKTNSKDNDSGISRCSTTSSNCSSSSNITPGPLSSYDESPSLTNQSLSITTSTSSTNEVPTNECSPASVDSISTKSSSSTSSTSSTSSACRLLTIQNNTHKSPLPSQQQQTPLPNLSTFDGIFNIRIVEYANFSTNEHQINSISRTRHLKSVNAERHLVLQWSNQENTTKFMKNFCGDSDLVNITIESKNADDEFIENKTPVSSHPTVEDCLELFLQEECLSNNNLWFCPRCKSDKAAMKKLDLWRLPRVLVLHLKRFRSSSPIFTGKINTQVDYPIKNLNLSRYVIDNSKNSDGSELTYDLVAVSNHTGNVNGGHYVCYAKNADSQQWYMFDDSSTEPISESRLVTGSAYVLVYVSRNSSAINEKPHVPNTNGDAATSINTVRTSDSMSCDIEDVDYMDVDIDSPE